MKPTRLGIWMVTPVLLVSAFMASQSSADRPGAHTSATCSDYSNQADAQRAKDTRDQDGDGLYCEDLPCPCLKPGGGGGGGGDPAGCRIVRLVRVRFDDDRWPRIADHMRDAQRLRNAQGRLRFPLVFHIDRAGADQNRRQATQGIPTRKGFDRDEYPPAVAREGGKGADVRYVRLSENRSAGAYMGNRLRDYCSKQRFRLLAVG